MWILESDGDIFKGKKLWLRPGKSFLFGRTSQEGSPVGQFIVTDKTISRKHLTVEVEPVPAAACADIKSRSRITLEDLGAKIGTLLNGEQIRGKKVVLDKPQNIVTLGKFAQHFSFTWVPVTLAYSFTSKELKSNPFTALYERLGPLDIKVQQDFQAGVTTHVVAKKRNTSKGLQALIGGKHIVHNDSFVQALVKAAGPGEGPSPLAEDFEGNFPDPLNYLPPKGDEPTQRDNSSYAPDPARQDMFEGYNFVFYEQRQYDILFAPISEGGGKVSLMQVVEGETTVDDFVRYVKGLAGEKGLGSFEDGTEGKGVIVVRFNPVKGDASAAGWYADFSRNVALRLDHRLIEQNEFLDAILGNDASVLRRPLEIECSGIVAPTPTAGAYGPYVYGGGVANYLATNMSFQAPQSSAPVQPTQASLAPPSPPARRGRSRRIGKKAINFDDDDFSGPMVPTFPVQDSMPVDPPLAVESQQFSQGLFVTQDPNMEIHREVSPMPGSQDDNTHKRKRSPSPIIEDDEEDMMEVIAPAAAAHKKQKLERGVPIAKPKAPVPKPEPKKPAPKKPKQEINVVEIARQRNEEAAALAAAEREALQEQMEGVDISEIRNLAIIEEMPIVRKPPPIRTARADESERWDDRWNGRKDFGRFRRRGNVDAGVRNRVIVALEEVKTKDYGIGADRWGDEVETSQTKTKKKKGTQSQSSLSIGPVTLHGRPADRARHILQLDADEELGSPEPDPEPEPEEENSDFDSELEIVAPPSRAVTKAKGAATSGVASKAAASKSTSQRSQKSTVTSQESARTVSGSKRAAEAPAANGRGQPPAKKQKQLGLLGRKGVQRSDDEDEDSDDDDMKFKFRRKR